MTRLGYPVQPISATINGPATTPPAGAGAWSAVYPVVPSGGVAPYGYNWSYSLACNTPPPPPCTGWVCTMSGDVPEGGPVLAPLGGEPTGDAPPAEASFGDGDARPCNQWIWAASAPSVSIQSSYFYRSMTVRLIVTDAVGTSRTVTKRVTFGYGRDGGDDETALGRGAQEDPSAEAQVASAQMTAATPTEYALYPAAPNPSAGRATVRFDLPEAADVSVTVVDLLGREVARLTDGSLPAGAHTARFDGNGLPPGVYVVRMTAAGGGGAGPFAAAQRITLVR